MAGNELDDHLQSFLQSASKALCRTDEEVATGFSKLFDKANPSFLIGGAYFQPDDQLRISFNKLLSTFSKRLGVKRMDRDSATRVLWGAAATLEPDSGTDVVKVLAKECIKTIEENAKLVRRFIYPNALIDLGGEQAFAIGPVKIVSGASLAAEFSAKGSRLSIQVGKPELSFGNGGSASFGVSSCCWDIAVVAAKDSLSEEAAWLAGIAISLMRLVAGKDLGVLVGRYGEVESHPFRDVELQKKSIVVISGSLTFGGMSLPARYFISEKVVEKFNSESVQNIVASIFNPAPNTIAVRVAQGLGWIARARQSDDKSERFLFIFTAIEALLSSDDKSAPVVQTIARHVASILNDDPKHRAKTAKQVKDLYAYRSALVHSGSRNVSLQQAVVAEEYAELLFWRILDTCDLGQSLTEFHTQLSECSYGLPWRGSGMHRLVELTKPKIDEDAV